LNPLNVYNTCFAWSEHCGSADERRQEIAMVWMSPGYWDETRQTGARMNDLVELLRSTAPIDMPLALLLEAADEIDRLTVEIEKLKGDLQIVKLQRDSTLCSQCPRAPEFEQLTELVHGSK